MKKILSLAVLALLGLVTSKRQEGGFDHKKHKMFKREDGQRREFKGFREEPHSLGEKLNKVKKHFSDEIRFDMEERGNKWHEMREH